MSQYVTLQTKFSVALPESPYFYPSIQSSPQLDSNLYCYNSNSRHGFWKPTDHLELGCGETLNIKSLSHDFAQRPVFPHPQNPKIVSVLESAWFLK